VGGTCGNSPFVPFRLFDLPFCDRGTKEQSPPVPRVVAVPSYPCGPAFQAGLFPRDERGLSHCLAPRPGAHGPCGQDCGTVPICPATGRTTRHRDAHGPMRTVRPGTAGRQGRACPCCLGRDKWEQSLRPTSPFGLPFFDRGTKEQSPFVPWVQSGWNSRATRQDRPEGRAGTVPLSHDHKTQPRLAKRDEGTVPTRPAPDGTGKPPPSPGCPNRPYSTALSSTPGRILWRASWCRR
jgi:hypothetical protein